MIIPTFLLIVVREVGTQGYIINKKLRSRSDIRPHLIQ